MLSRVYESIKEAKDFGEVIENNTKMLGKIYVSIKEGADFAEVVVHNKMYFIKAYVMSYFDGEFLIYEYESCYTVSSNVAQKIISYIECKNYGCVSEHRLNYINVCQDCHGSYYYNYGDPKICQICRDIFLENARNDVYFFSNDVNSFEGNITVSNEGWNRSSYVILEEYQIRKITTWSHPSGKIDSIVDEISAEPFLSPKEVELVMPKFLQFAADHLRTELCLIASLDLVDDIRRQIAMLYMLRRLC